MYCMFLVQPEEEKLNITNKPRRGVKEVPFFIAACEVVMQPAKVVVTRRGGSFRVC